MLRKLCWTKRVVLLASKWTKQPAREPLLMAFIMSLAYKPIQERSSRLTRKVKNALQNENKVVKNAHKYGKNAHEERSVQSKNVRQKKRSAERSQFRNGHEERSSFACTSRTFFATLRTFFASEEQTHLRECLQATLWRSVIILDVRVRSLLTGASREGPKGLGCKSPRCFKGVGRCQSGIHHRSWSDPFGQVC